ALDRAEAVQADTQRRLNAARAGLLARELEEGRPCPVCGATHHPAPAALAPGHVTEADCDAAAAALRAAQAAAGAASEKAGRALDRCATLEEQFRRGCGAFLTRRKKAYAGPDPAGLTAEELAAVLDDQAAALAAGLEGVRRRWAARCPRQPGGNRWKSPAAPGPSRARPWPGRRRRPPPRSSRPRRSRWPPGPACRKGSGTCPTPTPGRCGPSGTR